MTNATFDDRLSRIEAHHRRLSQGAVYRVGRDGLITAHPRDRLAPRLPGRSLVFLLIAVVLLKAALYIGLGSATYEARLERLGAGSQVEQGAQWLLQIDPVTEMIIAFTYDLID